MNAPHSPSLLAQVPMAPSDPILGITEAYVADPNPKKVNLGVGVYYDDNGKVPLLECVRRAESERVKAAPPRSYLPIDGLPAYDRAVQELLFTKGFGGLQEKRVVTVQALGGTGGLKIGADFLRLITPNSEVWISEPSWENHRQLFEAAGFTVRSYPYYDPKTHGLEFPGPRQPARHRGTRLARAARPVGAGARRDARSHQAHAPRPGEQDQGARTARRFQLHPHPARHVLVLGADQGAGAAPAQGLLDLRHRDRPYLRRRAQLRQRRLRSGRHRRRHPLTP